MKLILLVCSIAVVGLAATTDDQLQTTVKKLMDRVEHLEEKLKTMESDPIGVFFQGRAQADHVITRRGYTHSYNNYDGNGAYVFCGDDLTTVSRKRSTYSHSYNIYKGNGTLVFCGSGSGTRSTGMTYIVWGKRYCPRGQTLYSGIVGGNYVSHSAGSSNQVCLPDRPRYSTYTPGIQQIGRIYPSKYETQAYSHLRHAHGKMVGCAACYDSDRSTSIMIPATYNCPSGWTQQYYGYLMTQPDIGGYYRQEFLCVHKDMDGRSPPTSTATQAYLLSPIETIRNSGFYSLYDSSKELSCVVCSK